MIKEYELSYDYYKSKNFASSMNIEPFDGGASYEFSGGEGEMYCKEINDQIPEHLRNKDGSYELCEIAAPEMQEALMKIFGYSESKNK